ncbi:hypothetical protein ES703_04151 [subsurface metagenome]
METIVGAWASKGQVKENAMRNVFNWRPVMESLESPLDRGRPAWRPRSIGLRLLGWISREVGMEAGGPLHFLVVRKMIVRSA